MKTDEQKKKMKETCSQPKVMCQSKHRMFISKKHVLIETSPLHLQKVCVLIETPFFHFQEVCINRNTTSSFPRGMFPLGIETV
jgi:hypothetical protein